MGNLVHMRMAGMSALIALALAGWAAASVRDEQAAIGAILPGTIINKPWGWVISNPAGETHVIRKSDGYTITTPKQTFHLIRTSDGFTVAPGRNGIRELSPDQAIDVRERLRTRR